MPQGVLGRPRVDVTLRISGFFRDAFPQLIALVDSAARAVQNLDEPADLNPAAARAKAIITSLKAARARLSARFRGATGRFITMIIPAQNAL